MMSATGRSVGRILGNRKILMMMRLAVAAAFIAASCEKILYPNTFANIIHDYQILPVWAVRPVALWLPWTELVAGVALLAGIWTRAVGLLVSFLTFVFIAALIQAMARGLDFQCGCYSITAASDSRTWSSLWQESVLLAACLYLWIGHWKERARPRAEDNTG